MFPIVVVCQIYTDGCGDISYMVPSNRVVLSPENKPQHVLNAKVKYNDRSLSRRSFKTICRAGFEKNRLPPKHLMIQLKGVPSIVTCAAIMGQRRAYFNCATAVSFFFKYEIGCGIAQKHNDCVY